MDTEQSKLDKTLKNPWVLEPEVAKRIEKIKELVEKEVLVCTGDAITTTSGETLMVFVMEQHGVISICTPTGLVIGPAGEFFKWCQESGRNFYMKYLDEQIKGATALARTKGSILKRPN